ncbi:unnamed protein product [Trichobilharzia szidati]|nr:unnamed protein product [Trichobilharzia szidati]
MLFSATGILRKHQSSGILINTNQSISLLNLPDELILRILKYLNQIDLIRSVSRVNKRLHVLTRNSYFWKHLDLSGCKLQPKDLRLLSRQKLIGRQTCSVKIEFDAGSKNIESGLASIFKICGSLTHILIKGGCIQNFQNFLRIFSDHLENLELIETSAKNKLFHDESLPSESRFPLKSLNCTNSSWIHECHLHAFIGGTISKHLKHLNVSNCYRLFHGPPVAANFNVRFKEMLHFLKHTCPYLEKLNLSSVFVSQLHEPPVPSLLDIDKTLLGLLPNTLPSLYSLDLSQNTMIIAHLSYCLQNPSQYFDDIFKYFILSFFDKMYKAEIYLYLYGWPYNLIRNLYTVCNHLVPENSVVLIYVNNLSHHIEDSDKCKIISQNVSNSS